MNAISIPEPRLRKLSLQKTSITYVYILRSIPNADHFYIGSTANLRARLNKHNADEVEHTAKHKPWTLRTYLAFTDEKQALAFERYLKSPSGRAFSKKRLCS
jgi:putative endonuclease